MNSSATGAINEQALGLLLSFAAPPVEADPGLDDADVRELIAPSGVLDRYELPPVVDLRSDCSPVRWQGAHHTCSAQAVVALLELMEKRAFGRDVRLSPLFLHYEAKRRAGKIGTSGVFLAEVMAALTKSGIAPEEEWPSVESTGGLGSSIDLQPTASAYEKALRFEGLRCFRLDRFEGDAGREEALVARIKSFLAASIPCTLDFPLYQGVLEETAADGLVSLPPEGTRTLAQHTVLVVGYDDELEIPDRRGPDDRTRGAFLVKNSWSEAWGERGYGWLPYRWALDGHARSCWSMMRPAWMETGCFRVPANARSVGAALPSLDQRAVA